MNALRDILEKLFCFALAGAVWVFGAVVLALDWLWEKFFNHE